MERTDQVTAIHLDSQELRQQLLAEVDEYSRSIECWRCGLTLPLIIGQDVFRQGDYLFTFEKVPHYYCIRCNDRHYPAPVHQVICQAVEAQYEVVLAHTPRYVNPNRLVSDR